MIKYLRIIVVILLLPQYAYSCFYCEAGDPNDPNPDVIKRANSGDPRAQHILAWMYSVGWNFERNEQKSFYWIKKSADNGFTFSYHYLGVFYLEGIGVKQNVQKAIEWFEKSAFIYKGGMSTELLAEIYSNDKFMTKDLIKAYKWYKISSPKEETEKLVEIRSKMKPEEIKKAESLAEEWLLSVKNNPDVRPPGPYVQLPGP